MSPKELKQKFLDFFQAQQHQVIASAPLLPENDPTLLFTTAGMSPLAPYLMGESHPAGRRLVNVQKCIRTSDIDQVGNDWHLTFFEMLGNWSLGDYWKKEAITMSFEFLTQVLKIPKEKLAISCFAGDERVPKDKESAVIWRAIGIKESRLVFLGREDNWWGPVGQTGPCGPDTEIFYWSGQAPSPDNFDPRDKQWVEIWNNVFMQYQRTADGQYQLLKQKNVDTGMGVERTAAVLSGQKSVYEIDPLYSIASQVAALFNLQLIDLNDNQLKLTRIITDHLRAATFILAEGVAPGNVEQGYILRRLVRRSINYGRQLGINENFTSKIAEAVIAQMSGFYPELKRSREFIIDQMNSEEEKFMATLEKGLKEFTKIKTNDRISGEQAFKLFATYGFPLEMTKELAQEKGLKVDESGFKDKLVEHQKNSRAGAAKKFKGGLADHSADTARLHSAAHLMLAALRRILGEHVQQKGSNITSERLRFDFSHPNKLSPDQIKQVENLINDQIKKDWPVECQEMTVAEAKKDGAVGVFEHKYKERVKVYSMGDFSKEICGGPHVKRTGELGHFKIIKEESSSAGVRRIKAILE